MVGASLAVALKPTGLKTLVVEAVAPDSDQQASYDERTVALTYSARLIYEAMGVWQSIAENQAEPIKDIHISNKGHFGMTHLSCEDVGTEALGYVVPTRVIGRVLWAAMADCERIEQCCPAKAIAMDPIKGGNCVTIETLEGNGPGGQANTRQIRTRLVVIADGGRSFSKDSKDQDYLENNRYSQSAILSIVTTNQDHGQRAYERFTHEGPIAFLPHGRSRYATVWSTETDHIKERMALDDHEFIRQLQATFGDRAGQLSRPSPRKCYPLGHYINQETIGHHQVTIGNAAHIVHPVAGQGFNLGLRDVALLAQMLGEANETEFADRDMLNRFQESRRHDTQMVSQFTDGLIRIFSNNLALPAFIRNVGLAGIELFPPAKRFLLRRTMGLAGKQSRLARGQPLGMKTNE